MLGSFSGLLAAEKPPAYQQGLFVEENTEFPCAHECGPFEPVYFNFCFQSGERIFLARLFDTRFNYDPNKLQTQVGKTIQIRSDEKSLWIRRPDGKEFHIRQNYSDGQYVDLRCIAELHRHLLQEHPPSEARPEGVTADAVYVPLTARLGFWTKCFLAPDRAIVCSARGPKGEEFSSVYEALPEPRANENLIVDPLRTKYDAIVLRSGETLVRKLD